MKKLFSKVLFKFSMDKDSEIIDKNDENKLIPRATCSTHAYKIR